MACAREHVRLLGGPRGRRRADGCNRGHVVWNISRDVPADTPRGAKPLGRGERLGLSDMGEAFPMPHDLG